MNDWNLTFACVLGIIGWLCWFVAEFRLRTLRVNHDWNCHLLRKAWEDLNLERDRAKALARELAMLEDSGIAAKRRAEK